jgi:hypothetical protein
MGIVVFTFKAEIADIAVPPLADIGLAIIKADASQSGLDGWKFIFIHC